MAKLPGVCFVTFFLVVLVPLQLFSQTAKKGVYVLVTPDVPVSILSWNHRILLITQKAIYQVDKDRLIKQCDVGEVITSATANQGKLWVGTQKGLFFLDANSGLPTLLPLPALDTIPSITQVITDPQANVWIATQQFGVFRLQQERVEPMLAVFPVNGLACTKDGSVWVATNAGLYQSSAADSWQRYAEEGISGHEIPDSQVDHLFAGQDSVLWVVMPHAISFLNPLTHEGHAPAYDYLGAPDNAIYEVLRVRTGAYLVATQLGLIVLPSTPEHASDHEGVREIHPDLSQNKAILVQAGTLPLPAELNQTPIKVLYEDEGGNVWLANSKAMFRLKKKEVAHLLSLSLR